MVDPFLTYPHRHLTHISSIDEDVARAAEAANFISILIEYESTSVLDFRGYIRRRRYGRSVWMRFL
jgi:hypothetical protein